MLDLVRSTIRRYSMLRPGDRVGVAVSGGIDSVCLLNILLEFSTEFQVVLHVLHLNHGWRGDASDADAEFVRALASRLGLPCTIEVAPPANPGNLEQAGREARLHFFRRSQESFELNRIATGHTRSDQAETVLYRLLRGSGTAGLSGIRPVTSDGRIRPLLACSRAEIELWLRGRGIPWREDASNSDPAFDRNRIRHFLVPMLQREFQPAVTEILAATAELAQDEESWWESEVERLLPAIIEKKDVTSLVVRADKLSSLDPAPARRVIRRLLADIRGDLRGLDLTHVDRIRHLAAQKEGHGRIQVPGADIFRSFEWLRIGPLTRPSRFALDYAFPLDLGALIAGQRFAISHAGIAMFLQIQSDDRLMPCEPYNEEAEGLDADTLSNPLVLRNWRPGDEIDLEGRGPVKLKQLFQEFRIPQWERHLWPLITCGETVIWSRRFGPSAKHQRTSDTRCTLHVVVEQEPPGSPP